MDTVNTAGAQAVATYYMHLFPYIFATGDFTDYRALSHADCVYCANVLAGAEELAVSGRHAEGGISTVTSVTALEVDPGKWWTVDLELSQEPSRTVTATGEAVEEYPNSVAYHIDMAVIREGGRWFVREVTVTETSREDS